MLLSIIFSLLLIHIQNALLIAGKMGTMYVSELSGCPVINSVQLVEVEVEEKGWLLISQKLCCSASVRCFLSS